MRVFTLADCDPAGWQMPVSIGRKLQALRDLHFPDLDFEVIPVALTPDQVRSLNLPSTPLKASEKRANKWRAAWGIEQTEIDALATLRPELLAELLEAALSPFYDDTLDRRVALAVDEWRQEAQAAIDEQVDRATTSTRSATTSRRAPIVLDASNDRLQTLDGRYRTPRRWRFPKPRSIRRQQRTPAARGECLGLGRTDASTQGAESLRAGRSRVMTAPEATRPD